jgi:hypothetical protein
MKPWGLNSGKDKFGGGESPAVRRIWTTGDHGFYVSRPGKDLEYGAQRL